MQFRYKLLYVFKKAPNGTQLQLLYEFLNNAMQCYTKADGDIQ